MPELLSDRLERWLADAPPGRIVGRPREPQFCPVAELLKSEGIPHPEVHTTWLRLNQGAPLDDGRATPATDPVLFRFVALVDEHLRRAGIRAAAARRLLAQARREVRNA